METGEIYGVVLSCQVVVDGRGGSCLACGCGIVGCLVNGKGVHLVGADDNHRLVVGLSEWSHHEAFLAVELQR